MKRKMKEKDEFWQNLTEDDIIISSDDDALDNKRSKPTLTVQIMPIPVHTKDLSNCIMQFRTLIGILFGRRYYDSVKVYNDAYNNTFIICDLYQEFIKPRDIFVMIFLSLRGIKMGRSITFTSETMNNVTFLSSEIENILHAQKMQTDALEKLLEKIRIVTNYRWNVDYIYNIIVKRLEMSFPNSAMYSLREFYVNNFKPAICEMSVFDKEVVTEKILSNVGNFVLVGVRPPDDRRKGNYEYFQDRFQRSQNVINWAKERPILKTYRFRHKDEDDYYIAFYLGWCYNPIKRIGHEVFLMNTIDMNKWALENLLSNTFNISRKKIDIDKYLNTFVL